jgi:hypothetical protein
MIELYGKRHTRRDLARRAGSFMQFAGVQLSILGDGLERGIRCLEFRTGTGFIFKVLVDRAFDVAHCEYRGLRSAGIRRPVSGIPLCTNITTRGA